MKEEELSGLTVLLAVAEKRSFSAAAADLKVSPSAVSQTVSGLEDRLGVRLLARTTRSVGLTEAGERLVARLGPAIREVRAALEDLDSLRDTPRGVLRLNLPRFGYERLIEPRLSQFLARYPELQLDLVLDDSLADIVGSGCDAGVRLGEMLDREMVAVALTGPQRMAVVGSAEYFALRGKPHHPRDLLQHDCISYRQISSRTIYRWEFSERGRDFSIGVSGRLVANDLGVMVRAAVAGHGLAYVLESSVQGELRTRKLVRVLDRFCPEFPGFFLYYPARRHLPAKLAVFAEFFRAAPRR